MNVRLPIPVDPGRALLSVGLSVVLYFFALNETNPETTRLTDFSVVPEVVNTPSGLVVTDAPPPVRLRVRAPQDVVNRLSPTSFVAQVNTAGAQAGQQEFAVTVRSSDTDIHDVSAEPPRVSLKVEPVQERSLPVTVHLPGQVPFGYQVGTARVDPPQVTIAGPASVINRVVEAVVDVSVERVTVTVNGVYTPRLVDSRGSTLPELTIRPQSVTVEIPITQQTQYKQVGIRPVIQGIPAPGYVLQPVEVNPPSATLAGDPNVLQGINFVSTEPIDVNGISSSTVRRVGLIAPAQTLLVQSDQTVLATVRVAPLPLTQTFRVQPSIIRIPAGLVVASAPEVVTLTVSGPAPTLANLSPRDFQVVLDASGVQPGERSLKATVNNVPSGMSVDAIQPEAVKIRFLVAPTPAVPTPSP